MPSKGIGRDVLNAKALVLMTHKLVAPCIAMHAKAQVPSRASIWENVLGAEDAVVQGANGKVCKM